MRLLIVILTNLIFIGCNENISESISQKDRLELVLESENEMNLHKEQQQNDSMKNDAVYEEYLGARLTPIRTKVKRINEIVEWTSIKKRKLNLSTENGVAKYFTFRDTLLKVIVIHFGETGKHIQEFYTENGRLSFVNEQQLQYNRPIYWDSTVMKEVNDTELFDGSNSEIIENQSYFENEVLIRQISNQDCGSPFAEEYLKDEEVRLKAEFDKLKEKLKE